MLRVVSEAGLEQSLREPGTSAEIATRAGFAARQALVPLDWMLRHLVARGLVEELPDGAAFRYRAIGPVPALDPAPIREEQLRHDPSWMPAYVLAETVARDYPAFLRGEITGEELLFSPRRLRLWTTTSPTTTASMSSTTAWARSRSSSGCPGRAAWSSSWAAGLGSGALALLERLEAADRLGAIAEYRFTELVPAFLRRGRTGAADAAPGRRHA